MKRIIPALVLLSLTSCIVEKDTFTLAYVKNSTTSHHIAILPHKEGVVWPADTIRLAPGEEREVSRHTDRGLINHGGFHSEILFGTNRDSILVVFDGQFSVAHYFVQPEQVSARYYDYGSLRNLANYHAYDYSYNDPKKHQRDAIYRYRFTDSDYVFAAGQ